jgi:alpha-L-fucosidase 2
MKITKLIIMLIAIVMFSCKHDSVNSNQEEIKSPLKLTYNQPAKKWVEALPIGNGRLGAMVFGTPDNEHLQLNEETFWSGRPNNYNHTEAASHLEEVRKLIFAGEYKKAQDIVGKHMMGVPNFQQAYQPIGDLWLNFAGHDSITNYTRELNLNTALTKVNYKIGDAKFTREIFCSEPDQVIAIRISCDKPNRISFDAKLNSPYQQSIEVNNNLIVMKGQWEGRLEKDKGLIAKVDGLGTRFETQLKAIVKDGETTAIDSVLQIRSANEVTLLLTTATSYKNYNDISGNPSIICDDYILEAEKKNYNELYKSHLEEYSNLFSRVEFKLGNSDIYNITTDKLIDSLQNGADIPEFAALYFQYGRYLLISSSRPGTYPANLSGIWNKHVLPRWGSKYTVNINLPMNYWAAEVCNLSECHDPLFKMMEELVETGSETARTHYNSRGWVLHHNTDIWRGTAPVDAAPFGQWVTGSAWLCQHLWEHYLYTNDEAFLKNKAYPILKKASLFYVDFLVEHPQYGYLVTCPSTSPEHQHHKGVSVCSGPTVDNQLIRELFQNTIKTAEILNADEALRDTLSQIITRLPPNKIGSGVQLQEWLEDWDMSAPEITHRHLSNLYALHPGYDITPQRTPELAEACKVVLQNRGVSNIGWTHAWQINLWARLGESENAYHVLSKLFSENTFSNLMDQCTKGGETFVIDANFGATAGIAEMLLQSHQQEIHLLPALPAKWQIGSIKGLRARGGFEVDMEWDNGQLVKAVIKSLHGKQLHLRYADKTISTETEKGKSYQLNGKLKKSK